MEKKRIAIFFFIALVVGFVLVNQVRITDGNRLFVSPSVISEYDTTIESEIVDKGNIEILIKEAEAKLKLYAGSKGAESEAVFKTLSEEVLKYQMFSGVGEVEGPGIEILLDDGTRPLLPDEDINNLLVHDRDIVMIINELSRSGAEAVSVNGQRITASTAISCAGYTVRINGEVYARPFRIKAIGDSKRMSAALLAPEGYGTSLKNPSDVEELIGAPGGYGTSLRNWGVEFEIKVLDNVEIKGGELKENYKYSSKMKGVE